MEEKQDSVNLKEMFTTRIRIHFFRITIKGILLYYIESNDTSYPERYCLFLQLIL